MSQDVPLACDLSVLSAEERARHAEISERLRGAFQHVEPLPDGYAFSLPPQSEYLLLAAEFITRERLCCPFFRFELVAEPGGEPFSLRLTGGEEVKAFLETEMNLPLS
jgi:hypothetical protein